MSEANEPDFDALSVTEARQLVTDGVIEGEEWVEYVEREKVLEEKHVFNQEAPGEPITDDVLAEGADRADSWLSYNKGLQNKGYSPAERITPDNVDQLEQEYTIETDTGGMQTHPVVAPGDPPVMYFTDMEDTVTAANARTGEVFWEHSPEVQREEFTEYAVTNRSRGVGIWEDRVFVGTNDGYMVALDRHSGDELWRTDLLWEEDLPEGMEEYPQTVTAVTAEPVAYDGILFTGSTTDQVQWGAVHALDAETGEKLWSESTVDPDGWVEETWAFGNSVAWMNPVVDPETETVLFNLGDPSSFFNSVHRPGPNKHSVSIMAMSFDGEVKWINQLLAHDLWDYDCCSTPTVTNATVGGEDRRVVIEDAKTGWTHALDIETGRYIQRSEPFARQEHRFGAWPDSEYLNYPPFDEDAVDGGMHPGFTGGSHFQPDSYSPRTNMRYVGNQDAGGNKPLAKGNFLDNVEYGSTENHHLSAGEITGHDGTEPENTIVALDMDTGEIEWEYLLEDSSEHISSPGGPTTTASGVLFGLGSNGKVVALEDETGEELWVDELDEPTATSPITWDDPAAGTQYLGIVANDKVVVYGLEAEIDDDSGDDGGSDGGDDGASGGGDDGASGGDADTSGGDDGADDDGAGFGFISAIAGAGAGAAYAAKRRLGTEEENQE